MPHKEDVRQPVGVPTTLNYFSSNEHPNGKEVIHLGSVGDKLRSYDARPALITDIRSCEGDFSFDEHGFQYVFEPTSLQHDDFSNVDRVKQRYYLEAADMLKRMTGASDVLCMSHLVRSSTWEDVQEEAREAQQREGDDGICQKMNPARTAHCDQSYLGAEQVLRTQYSDERAEELMKRPWAIINVWRPLRPVNRDPLAVCDWRTICEADDLVGVDVVLPAQGKHKSMSDAHGAHLSAPIWERWDLKYSPNHKWYYASHMKPEECLLLKIFDSRKDGRARCSPHTAFPTEQDEGPARESIELRTIVFWDNETAA